jgi:hypothetical protein
MVQAFGRGPGRQSGAALVHWANEERFGRSKSGARLAERQRLGRAAWSAQMRARGRHARRRAQELAAQGDGVRAVAYGSWWSTTWRRVQERAARSALECKRWATGGHVARAALERVCERGSDAARPGEHGFGSRKRKSSCTACRTTMCREITRDAREVAMRRLQADLPRKQ